MACSMIYKLTCVLVVCMLVVSAPYAEAAVTCNSVYSNLYPCLSYVSGNGGPVPSPCCTGIKSLSTTAKSTPDRQTVCRCLTQAARGVNGLNMKLIASLPSKCGVYIPYPISPSTDCSKVRS